MACHGGEEKGKYWFYLDFFFNFRRLFVCLFCCLLCGLSLVFFWDEESDTWRKLGARSNVDIEVYGMLWLRGKGKYWFYFYFFIYLLFFPSIIYFHRLFIYYVAYYVGYNLFLREMRKWIHGEREMNVWERKGKREREDRERKGKERRRKNETNKQVVRERKKEFSSSQRSVGKNVIMFIHGH